MSDKMVEKVTEKLTKMVSRRGILASLSAGAVALVSSLFGNAEASTDYIPVACCLLCKSPTWLCSGICCWSWDCSAAESCTVYRCTECYSDYTACTGNCNSRVKCSGLTSVGRRC